MRAEGPSGLMKVRSTADLFAGRGWLGLAAVPENPVTMASPRPRPGGRLACCAPAVPENSQSKSSGKSRRMNLNKINLPSAVGRTQYLLIDLFVRECSRKSRARTRNFKHR